MSGALSAALAPRRRGWATGGGSDEGDPIEDRASRAPGPAPSPGAMARSPIPLPPPAPPQSPLEAGMVDENGDPQPPPQGAISRGMPDTNAEKANAMQRAIAVLQAGQTTNLPLLMAAGALLSPTRTGGFAESLGNAINQSVPVAESERRNLENMALRQQQNDAMNAYRQQMAQASTTRANAYEGVSAARTGELTAQAALMQAKAALGANAKTTTADLQKGLYQALLAPDKKTGQQPINPSTGAPWTEPEAMAEAMGLNVKRQNADANTDRADAAGRNADTNATRADNAAADQAARRDIASRHADANAVNTIMNTAKSLKAADLSGKTPFATFAKQAEAEYNAQLGRRQGAGAAPPAAGADIPRFDSIEALKAANLPKGAHFIGGDGVERVIP